ncbi:phage tail spike protein [Weissella cibaria]|uniref:phage tail spike protein n=1 Tax=Weissella cibaria TaxID=137591 RepID=UPI002A75CCC2|nr:phage tail spike protein [Weissella cibaria]MDY2520343.1 phage tail spike protein [Weissella cibaria]
MTPILYKSDEIDFTNNGLGQLNELYSVDVQEQRNGLLTFTGSYPVTGQHYADISEGRIILAKPSPLDDNHAFRIVNTQLDIAGHSVHIEADSITYDLTKNIVKSVTMKGNGSTAMSQLQSAIVNPSIFTLYSDITTSSTSTLNYVNPMEAIAGTQGSFLQYWGGEMKRENRRVAMLNRRGRDNVATFRLGKNINGLRYTVDTSNLVTQVIPMVSLTRGETTRYLEGATVSSKRIGNYPIKYTQSIDVTDKITIKDGDADKVIVDRINAYANNWFTKSENTAKDLPDVTIEVDVLSLQDSADYADKFAKLETIGLTDTVTVYVPEYGVNVTAIVNELHYDPIGERVTSMVVGTAKISFAEANQNALSDLQDKVTQVQEQASQAVISANGKNSSYSGRNEPAHPQEGDTWFWDDGTDSGIRVFTNGKWVDSVDTKTLERINNAVDGAIETSQTYTDELNEKQVQTTNALSEKVDKSVKELTDSQQAISSQATAYTDSAVADANSKAVQIGQTTAQNAQSALNEAKKDFTSSFASQASQTASMASEANSKASQYASQAKSEAVSVATSADGVVRTEFKSTTDSMTATIQKNKSDADGKISTAQTTATQALNGLATKVSQTEYNTKTGQLQTDLTATTQTANQAKTDIVSIKQKDGEQDEKMNSIVSDVNGTKQTVSDLQTVQGKQSGDISTLQQRADGFETTVTKIQTSVNNMGQVNQLFNTEFNPDFAGWVNGNKSPYVVDGSYNGSVRIRNTATVAGNRLYSELISVKGVSVVSTSVYNDSWSLINGYDENKKLIGELKANLISSQGLNIMNGVQIPSTVSYITFGVQSGLNSYISQPMLVFAPTVGSYVQGNYNNNGAVAKAQLTADQATVSINNYKTDADGRIRKAQADIVANANAITQKVSQSDYNAKTGELTQSVSKVQQTADTATQTIGTYKESNDKRVTAAETNIKANADAILLTASKTELNSATGELKSDISTLQQRADGFDATVAKIQTSVNNLGQINQLFNTEFSPDFAGWVNGNKVPYVVDGSYNGSVRIRYTSATVGNRLYSGLISVQGVSVVSTSVYNDSWSIVRGYDQNKKLIGELKANFISIQGLNVMNGIPIPSTVYYIDFGIQSGVNSYVSQPMLVFSPTVGSYVQGNYNNNDAVAQVELTADGLYETVNNPTTGIATRLLTAEGTITTVQNATNELTSKQTLTANGLTQEISDRQTGDSNTLQAGKDFTTSQITSYDTGMQSRLTQVSDGIMAQVSATNLIVDSSFVNALVNWTVSGDVAWKIDTGNMHEGVRVAKFDNGDTVFDRKTATLTSIPIYTMNLGGTQFYASFDLHAKSFGTSAYFKAEIVQKNSSGTTTKTTAIGGSFDTAMSDWTNYTANITLDPATTQLYLQFTQYGGGVIYVSRPYLGSVQLQKNAYIAGASTDNSSTLKLFNNFFAFGIQANTGALIAGINGDSSGLNIVGEKITITGDTTFIGKNFMDGALIKNASIGEAQIADVSITNAKIASLDVNKISGNVSSFIQSNWNGKYGSTTIDANGMKVDTNGVNTQFGSSGMKLTMAGESVGGIGVQGLTGKPNTYQGLTFWLDGNAEYMAWGARNSGDTSMNPVIQMSWYRSNSAPTGAYAGFNFDDDVIFNQGINVPGVAKEKLGFTTKQFNGFNYPYFGDSRLQAGLAYGSGSTYLISGTTYYNLTRVIKALDSLGAVKIPSEINSDGTVKKWFNVTL